MPTQYEPVFFDIETTGLLPWYGDQVTCIGAKFHSPSFQWTTEHMFTAAEDPDNDESEVALLSEIAAFLKDMMDNEECGQVCLVTKNGKEFDLPFILARMTLNGFSLGLMAEIVQCDHFDLHHVTSKRVSLQQIAELYGVDQKSGTGENAIKLWEEGRLDELKEYCWQDVLTTEQVFLKWKELNS